MSNLNRVYAINALAERIEPPPAPGLPVSTDDYAEDVFNSKTMRQYLPKAVAEKLLATIQLGKPLDPAIAGDVARAMKQWAIERGATHFSHWFQPLTGGTAEKHDAFLEPQGDSAAILSFSGKNLIVGEPDASSFPSGGLRSTFEARGYTAWDPTSPAFIKRHPNGATLCIPTAFCSYTGEALDNKTPLLRSVQALNNSVGRLMQKFQQPVQHVTVTLGAEQEYFLIDRKFYLHRPDLVQTGRTLFGAPPPKHQQLDDHYFGAIRQRVLAFMADVEQQLWRLGIPAKTRHNEAAPAQFELAPLFEELNLAVDHNMLTMEVLRQVAERHGFVCLLHEKPFAGINGSGKHNNWSVSCGGKNLLDPGSDPHQNAIFLTVLCAIIRAVDLHSDLLRAATASAGNDHRLGACEAPPAILSIFLGDQLADVIAQLEKGAATSSKRAGALKIGIDTMPPLPRDVTDRNRTSPIAFTGNKFEFRGPGSNQSCAEINTVINTIVAESLDAISDEIEKFNGDFNTQLQKLLHKIIKAHKRILFNGDNYSAEWAEEAARRGLPNLHNTPEALKPLLDPANQALLSRYNVYSKAELDSRYEVFLAEYQRKIRIEGKLSLNIARGTILPVVAQEYGTLAATLSEALKSDISSGVTGLRSTVERLGKGLDDLVVACDQLESALKDAPDAVIPAMAQLRKVTDQLELIVDDSQWPLPKYREMLFLY
ncbi:MAG: glutamine synthetase III [Lentisphaeria bacterium]|nr:glutamine synthetase III [Lentisphaeria bacterium]